MFTMAIKRKEGVFMIACMWIPSYLVSNFYEIMPSYLCGCMQYVDTYFIWLVTGYQR